MIYLTRRETFNAAHRLYNNYWTEEQNELVFGKCANKNWHGHNYTLFVTVKGQPNPDTGFIVNVKELSALIKEKVVNKLDHTNLNLDVEFTLLSGSFYNSEEDETYNFSSNENPFEDFVTYFEFKEEITQVVESFVIKTLESFGYDVNKDFDYIDVKW